MEFVLFHSANFVGLAFAFFIVSCAVSVFYATITYWRRYRGKGS